MSKHVVITGASRGIGRAIASKYAQMGYDLFLICHKNKDLLNDLCEDLMERYHISCYRGCADVGNPYEVQNIFREVYSTLGSVDILVNNAGISHIGLLSDMTVEEWQRVINTNLNSVFYCCHEVIPQMVADKYGKIVNISSVWGNVGASCEVAYSASKGGINSFTKALAKELAPSNIQVNAIACGAIDTEMNQFLEEEDRQALIDEIPACRMGRPDEVGELVYSITEGASYLTGQVITLDGGWI